VLVLPFVSCGLLVRIGVYAINPTEAKGVLGWRKRLAIDTSRMLLAVIFRRLGVYFAIQGMLDA